MDLPIFKYHPDPVATGHFQLSKATCKCCGKARGYIYTGPAYAKDDLDNAICPWCIAGGEARAKFNVEFTDRAGIGGYGDWEKVSLSVAEEIAFRTPGFCGWQQERWWTHCGDGAEFLGAVGRAEAEKAGAAFLSAIQKEAGLQDDDWHQYLSALDRDHGPTAYLFRCLHCGAFGGYSDCH